MSKPTEPKPDPGPAPAPLGLTPPQRLIDGLSRDELLTIVLDPEAQQAEAEQRRQESAAVRHTFVPSGQGLGN